jgi:hypothetical protein
VTTGAVDLWHAINNEASARGVNPDDIVEVSKYTNSLTDALYGVSDRPPKRRPAASPENNQRVLEAAHAPRRRSIIAKAVGWLAGSRGPASEAEQTNKSGTALASVLPPEERPKTLPQGVIVFPEMRHHDGISPSSVTTPYNEIEAFCAEHNVPIVYAERSDAATAIGEMLTPSVLLPLDENQV